MSDFQTPTSIVFLTIGPDEDLHQQAIVALLSCMGYLPDADNINYVMITDQPHRYGFFGDDLDLLVPTTEQLQQWRGPYDLFSRIKIEALMEMHRTRGPSHILCLDSDILARRDLSDLLTRIGEGELFMHLIEYPWHKPNSPRQKKVWEHLKGKTYADHLVDESTLMWNAGVQGFGWRHRQVLDKELAVYDAFSNDGLYKLRHTTQQHTISLVMQQHGTLQPAEQWFDHYWANKTGHMPSIHKRLASILARGMTVREAAQFIVDEPIKLPMAVKNRWYHDMMRNWLPY